MKLSQIAEVVKERGYAAKATNGTHTVTLNDEGELETACLPLHILESDEWSLEGARSLLDWAKLAKEQRRDIVIQRVHKEGTVRLRYIRNIDNVSLQREDGAKKLFISMFRNANWLEV